MARMVSEVSRIIDSPTANLGWTPASKTMTRSPWRARIAPRVEPLMPEPMIATSYRRCINLPFLPAANDRPRKALRGS